MQAPAGAKVGERVVAEGRCRGPLSYCLGLHVITNLMGACKHMGSSYNKDHDTLGSEVSPPDFWKLLTVPYYSYSIISYISIDCGRT